MKYYELKDGTKLAYDDEGTGRPVVFLHGWSGERKSNFGAYVPLCSKHGYRAVNYDQRGSGETTDSTRRPVTVQMLVEDLHELLAGLGLTDATLVGSSMGSNEILQYVEKYGCDEYIHSVVLVDQSPCITKKDGWDFGMYRGAYTLEQGLADYEKMKSDWMGYYVAFNKAVFPELEEQMEEEVLEFVRRQNSNFHTEEMIELFLSTQYVDVRGALPKVTVPCGYFYADPGALYSPQLWEYYRDHVGGAYKPVAFSTRSHAFFWEMVDAFGKELLCFLEEY